MTTGDFKFVFEVSIIGEEEWQEIPEQVFYDSLYKYETKLTPCITEMLSGKYLAFGTTLYRIRSVPNPNPFTKSR